MKTSIGPGAAVAALLSLAACDGGADSAVARAAGHELTVPQAVTLLVGESFPNDPEVTYTVAELWIDYVLLARAMADDSTLSQLDLSRIVDQQIEQELLIALRDADVRPDTTVSDEEVQRRLAQMAPGARVRARHIFLAHPESASPAQRDSVHQAALALLERIGRGESFEALAAQYSQDRATAAEGGDLGWIGHNELLASLEDAMFALEPGHTSGVVESAFGLHILRVDDRQMPSVEDLAPEARARIQAERIEAAESELVASAQEGADVQVVPGAADLVRRLADEPGMRLGRRARGRALVRYRGGKFTVGEMAAFMQSRTTEFRFQIYGAPDDVIEENLLLGLAQRKLLVERARQRGFEIGLARRDSLEVELRSRLAGAARELELARVVARDGESAPQARERQVEDVLRDMLQGMRDVMPLGSFSFILRDRYGGQVYGAAVERVVQRIEEVRGPAGAPPAERPEPQGDQPPLPEVPQGLEPPAPPPGGEAPPQ